MKVKKKKKISQERRLGRWWVGAGDPTPGREPHAGAEGLDLVGERSSWHF